ncbi:hypothetical protein RBSH_03419 [Rhodopirellula baltica SH28]|uniref:Uncharacterized protein n=1 Tax=Rhodopirellula baltica SH28 TaxID=993517 RepID=K5CCD6_RHOBT|nr:hypothetical protein RBSH_03419 [Rhodopirellula baltica SH28]
MTTDAREGLLVRVLASLLAKHRLDCQVEPGLQLVTIARWNLVYRIRENPDVGYVSHGVGETP